MSNFTFTHQQGNKTSVCNFEAETWFQALDEFVKFLRGAGYALSNNSVGINSANHLIEGNLPNLWNVTDFSQKG